MNLLTCADFYANNIFFCLTCKNGEDASPGKREAAESFWDISNICADFTEYKISASCHASQLF